MRIEAWPGPVVEWAAWGWPGTTSLADAYNFGNAQGLTWTAPVDLFAPAYGTIQKLAKKKPFWISETGSTARGGDGTAHEASTGYHRLVTELFVCGTQAADALVMAKLLVEIDGVERRPAGQEVMAGGVAED